MKYHDRIRSEIDAVSNNGVITPRAVLEKARDPDSLLHDHFTWDDSVAAEMHRLEEARRLIRVYVVTPDDPEDAPVRAFVSLSSDRKAGGGYRALVAVLNDRDLYQQMLADALAEFEAFERKYTRIQELKPVFEEAKRVRRKHHEQEERAAA